MIFWLIYEVLFRPVVVIQLAENQMMEKEIKE